jgi:hypothetical protein
MDVSTKNNPAQLVAEAYQDEMVAPLGEFLAQKTGNGGIRVPFPQPHARQAGLAQSQPVEIYLHVPTGGIIVIPAGETDG